MCMTKGRGRGPRGRQSRPGGGALKCGGSLRGGARPWCPARPGPFGCFSGSHAIALLPGSQGSGAAALPREMAKEAEPSARRVLLQRPHPRVRPKQIYRLNDHEGGFLVGEPRGHSALSGEPSAPSSFTVPREARRSWGQARASPAQTLRPEGLRLLEPGGGEGIGSQPLPQHASWTEVQDFPSSHSWGGIP